MNSEGQVSYTTTKVLPPRIKRLLKSDVCLDLKKVLIRRQLLFICKSNGDHKCAFNSPQALQNYSPEGPYTCRALKQRTGYGKIGKREAKAIKENGILRTHGTWEYENVK
jgi:hypothetical protein